MSTHMTEILFKKISLVILQQLNTFLTLGAPLSLELQKGMNGMQQAEERRMSNPHVSRAHPLSCAGRGCQSLTVNPFFQVNTSMIFIHTYFSTMYAQCSSLFYFYKGEIKKFLVTEHCIVQS